MCSNKRPVKKPAMKTHPHQNRQPLGLALGPVWQSDCCAPVWAVEGFAMHPMLPPTKHMGTRSCKAGQEQASLASSRVVSGAEGLGNHLSWEHCWSLYTNSPGLDAFKKMLYSSFWDFLFRLVMMGNTRSFNCAGLVHNNSSQSWWRTTKNPF